MLSEKGCLARAGAWFLHSGIQEPNGGVARYYLCEERRNLRVSTEITGYAVSALAYLHARTGDIAYLDAANRAARFLIHEAWDEDSSTFPFEPLENGAGFAYFFDCGIIVRGLLTLWRRTRETDYFERAKEAALAMAFDFPGEGVFHPIITLPEKQPLAYEPRWSRSPGCYQAKSAMAWFDLATMTQEQKAIELFETVVAYGVATHDSFLPGDPNPERVMDRLHAYCYFLEALLPVARREPCAEALRTGIDRVGHYLREISPVFERSDVGAQLLRVRLMANLLGAVPLDVAAAREEAERAASFQSSEDDPRLSGGFYFGRKHGALLPYMNPVSTAFCLQALEMWDENQRGALVADTAALI